LRKRRLSRSKFAAFIALGYKRSDQTIEAPMENTTKQVAERVRAQLIPSRVEGFDLLRGLCAIGVACYHIFSWRDGFRMHTLGRYGVYVFFVLSGASMYVAYSRKFAQGYDSGRFILLRFVRLSPLFALVLVLTTAKALAGGKSIVDAAATGLLNLSFTFGFGNPVSISAVTGGWSLGIEFVFYLVFPVMLSATRSRAWLALLIATFVLQYINVSQTLGGKTFSDAWADYSHPLSFAFYFMAGCCIGRLVEEGRIRPSPRWMVVFLIAALPLLVLQGDDNLTGWKGAALPVCAAVLALSAAGLPIRGIGSVVSNALGRMSYGLYLIHSLVFAAVSLLFSSQPTVLVAGLTITISAVSALVIETFYEGPVQERLRKMLGI
jgi:exopolysaccharide production protein ExoZ